MNDWHVQAAPFVNADAESDGFGCNGKHCWVVRDEDDTARWRNSCFNDANDVRNRQAHEERPHGEVLESGWRRRELVAERIVLHVNADQVVQAGSWEAEDARDLLGMEQVGGLIPMDPHATEIVSKKVVERVAREEAQAVWDPVCFVGLLVVAILSALPEIPDGLSTLLVGARPDTESDAIESVAGVLLEDEGVVDAVRLASAGADFDVVGEARLSGCS
jgi:hypothetical protein